MLISEKVFTPYLVLTKILSSNTCVVVDLLPTAAVDIVRLCTSATIESHGQAFLLRYCGFDGLHLLYNILKFDILLWLGRLDRVVVNNELDIFSH
jgi:hypothetical protein